MDTGQDDGSGTKRRVVEAKRVLGKECNRQAQREAYARRRQPRGSVARQLLPSAPVIEGGIVLGDLLTSDEETMDVDQEEMASGSGNRGNVAKSWKPEGHGKYSKVTIPDEKVSEPPVPAAGITPVPVVVTRKKVPRFVSAGPESVTRECKRTLKKLGPRRSTHKGQSKA